MRLHTFGDVLAKTPRSQGVRVVLRTMVIPTQTNLDFLGTTNNICRKDLCDVKLGGTE
jgi:hypothetical protein